MFNLAPIIIAGCIAGLSVNSIAEKQRNRQKKDQLVQYIPPVQYIPAENPGNCIFAFSEETVREKMGRIAERFKLRMRIEKRQYKLLPCSKSSSEIFKYRISLMGKYSFIVEIDFDSISILPADLPADWYEKSFVLCDKSYLDEDYFYDDEEDVGFPCEILAEDISDDEIFGIIEKMIDVLYGVRNVKYEVVDAKKSFIFYLDAPDYYGYTETTEIGNFKFILNKENGGN